MKYINHVDLQLLYLNKMESTLLILTSVSFLIFFLVLVFFYTPDCFNLRVMMDSIDSDGELTKIRAPKSWYLNNIRTLDCWLISLPKSEKYLKHEQIKQATIRVRNYRKIMLYIAIGMILFGFVLLRTVK